MRVFSRIIFFSILAELIVGGGGRLMAAGPVSLRMVLFSIALIISIIEIFRGRRIPQQQLIFLLLFISALAVATGIGIVSGAEQKFWMEDLKPLLYVLILPFFSFVTSDLTVEKPVAKMIVFGGLLMAFTFFLLLIAIHSELLPFLTFYDSVIGTGEFFFRAETTFFYKGFIYLCIALIFLYFIPVRLRMAIAAFLVIAIVFTFTRGFIFALSITFVFYAAMEKKIFALVASAVFVFAFIMLAKPLIYQASATLHALQGLDEKKVPREKLLGNRDESDAGRVEQMQQVFQRVTPSSFLFGQGFGIGVPARPVHMEISYLEIFHKQGLFGLAVWTYLVYLLIIKFRTSSRDPFAKAFFYSAMFLFFQSLTNQFINNPIGLSFVLLSLAWFDSRSSGAELMINESPNARLQKGDEFAAINF